MEIIRECNLNPVLLKRFWLSQIRSVENMAVSGESGRKREDNSGF